MLFIIKLLLLKMSAYLYKISHVSIIGFWSKSLRLILLYEVQKPKFFSMLKPYGYPP